MYLNYLGALKWSITLLKTVRKGKPELHIDVYYKMLQLFGRKRMVDPYLPITNSFKIKIFKFSSSYFLQLYM